MKNLFRCLVLSATVLIPIIPTSAQTPVQSDSTSSPAVETEAQINYRLYLNFDYAYRMRNDRATFKAVLEYVQRYPNNSLQTDFVKKWLAEYYAVQAGIERERRRYVKDLINQKDFEAGFAHGKEILASAPDDMEILCVLAHGGAMAMASGNNAFVADAINYARKAFKLIESGRARDVNEKTLGRLNFDLGVFTLVSAPAESAEYMFKAFQYAAFRNDPWSYSELAEVITEVQYRQAYQEYESRFATPQQKASEEGEIAKLRLDLIVDQMVDALARAVALAGSEPKFAPDKAVWLKTLTHYYMNRNSSYDTGLREYVERVLAKPLPFLSQHPPPNDKSQGAPL